MTKYILELLNYYCRKLINISLSFWKQAICIAGQRTILVFKPIALDRSNSKKFQKKYRYTVESRLVVPWLIRTFTKSNRFSIPLGFPYLTEAKNLRLSRTPDKSDFR